MSEYIIITCLVYGFCLILGPIFIPILRGLKFGQSILEVGPKWHIKKTGTPTIGGIIFITAMLSMFFIVRTKTLLIMFAGALLFAVIGFIDDFIKVVLKRNLGLTAGQKLTLQILAALAFLFVTSLDTPVKIPFSSLSLSLGKAYVVFTTLVMLSTINSVNLTDGIDGLAASVSTVVCLFFGLVALKMGNRDVACFAFATMGGCIGFLMFNFNPAKVFMGDTGSLFLGGAISIMAIMLGLHFLLIIAGGVFLLETLSVIIQVASFKLTGKRVFKMTPIHHHFEMCGYTEKKIVSLFAVITLILCTISYLTVLI